MRASSDPVEVGRDEVRASDAERDQAIDRLRDRFAEGRLSQETFLYRMDVAMGAKFPSELSGLFVDLPVEEPGRGGFRAEFRDRLIRLRHATAAQFSGRMRPARSADAGWQPGGYPGYQPPGPYPLSPPGPPSAVVAAPDPQPLVLPRQEDRKLSIGRAPSCDYIVPDISVSRWHARLHKQDECWLLSDLGSTNGTRLNGWRVTAAVPVRPGDQITFGNAAFLVIDDSVRAGHPHADPVL